METRLISSATNTYGSRIWAYNGDIQLRVLQPTTMRNRAENKMKRGCSFLISVILWVSLIPAVVHSAGSFYEGKTVRLVAGGSAGGGIDAYARIVARHIGRYIPGNPTIITENMPGAGSIICAKHLFNVAKPDGLTFGHFSGGLFFSQMLGQPGLDFDALKFEYVGAPAKEEVVFSFSKASGITSLEKWVASKVPMKIGGTMPGAFAPDNVIRIIKAALGLPINLVSGYKGTAEIRMAVESGELAGAAWGWESMRVSWRKGLESGDVAVVLQAVPRPFKDLPNIPCAISLARTEEARQLIEIGIHSNTVFARPLVMPPGTPKERVEIFRTAFQKTMTDKKFLEEAEKTRLGIDPVSAEELEKTIGSIFKIDASLIVRLRDIIFK